MRAPLLLWWIATTVTLGCSSDVVVMDGEGGDSGCGTEPPETWCGPWTCVDGVWQEPCCGAPDCCGSPPSSAAPECSVECNDGSWFARCPCPDSFPAFGSSCPDPMLPQFTCSYDDPVCGYLGDIHCEDAAWTFEWSSSDCCPLTAPAPGASCEPHAAQCHYVTCYDEVLATCPAGTWELELLAPLPACAAASADECKALEGCRWLDPGCEDEPGGPPGITGCFPIEPCVTSDGPAGGVCVERNINPCVETGCTACSSITTVCVPFEG